MWIMPSNSQKTLPKGNISINELVNSLVEEAARDEASDIHIEPLEKNIRIRFRIDGVLQERYSLAIDTLDYIINRLKIICNLEMGNLRVPEDGHFSVLVFDKNTKKERELDVRVSIFPTVNGQAAVLRILNRSEMLLSLSEVGFKPDLLEKVRKLAMRSYGMILATGPTGSGKTTTLYSMLMQIDRSQRNIITLEDPIEFRFEDIRQSQVRTEIGYTFARGMRSILRQDPDVIMIGEIRDEETAKLAVKAALSGRAVYSTLHANTTVGAIAHLIDMNIERGLIAYAVSGIISQRLVRKICPNCIIDDNPREEYLNYLNLGREKINFKKGAGCENCGQTGYRGRVGIFEVLIFDENLRALIVDKAPMSVLQQYAEQAGMQTLREEAIEKVASGVTSVEEIVRIS